KESVFWPGMTVHLAQRVKSCGICNETAVNQQKEPLQSTPVPTYPWQIVSCDIFEPVGKRGTYYMVLSDVYSNFFELDHIAKPSTECVVKVMKAHFGRHGIPMIL